MKRRNLLKAASAVSAGLLAGCTGGGDGGGDGGDGGDGGGENGAAVEETATIAMGGSQFDPRNAHVDAGTTVTWTNDDSVGHTVSSASDNWDFDETVDGGGEATYTFEDGGVYDVYCRFHGSADLSGMSMKIAVGDATIENPVGGGSSSSDGGGGGPYG